MWAEGRRGRAGVQGTSKTNPLPSRCSRAPAADGPVPEIHPLGPGPPAPTGHRHPAPASVSQKLSTVPVRLRSSSGYPHAAGPGISWPRSTFRKGRSSSPHGPRTLSSLKRPGCVPTLEKEMSLVNSNLLLWKRPSEVRHLLGSHEEPAGAPAGRPRPSGHRY